MRQLLRNALVRTLTLVAACTGAAAGPLDRAIIHPEARWIVHIDVESALLSQVGTHLIERMEKEPRQPLARMSREFGFSPRSDLKAVTVFALPGQIDDGVAILTVSAAADGMGESLQRAEVPELETTVRGEFTIHSWKKRGRTFRAAVHTGLREGERLIVLADSERVLDIGIGAVSRAVHGEACKAPARLPPDNPRAGSFLFVAAGDLNAPGEPRPRAELLREATSLVLDVGRDTDAAGDSVYGDANIVAADQPTALKVRQLAQGVLAYLALSAADQPEDQAAVGDLVGGVTITAENGRCIVTSRHQAKTVVAVYDMMEERRREARAAENHRPPAGDRPDGGESPKGPRHGPK